MTQINIKGPVVSDGDKWFYDYFKMPAVSPSDINDALPDDGSEVDVIVNSGGGLINAGSEIYTALRNYAGTVNVHIVGMAASAASVIAMAGDHVEMSPTAQMMIHNVKSTVSGDSNDHKKEAGVLETFNKSFATPYVDKTGMSEEEVLNMMNETTWLNAEQAKEKGLVDEIMFDKQTDADLQLTNVFGAGLASPDMISEAREKLLNNQSIKDQTVQISLSDESIGEIKDIIDSKIKDFEETTKLNKKNKIEQRVNPMFVF